MSQLILQNDVVKGVFDAETGALVELVNLRSNWNLIKREDLGLSFRMQVPGPGSRATFVNGEGQPAKSAELTDDGKSLVLTWENPKTEDGEALDITLVGRVRVNEQGLVFEMDVENRTDRTIEALAYPCLGGITPEKATGPLYRTRLGILGMWREEIYPHFNNRAGYWGTYYCTDNDCKSTDSPFVMIETGSQGFYVGRHAEDHRNLVGYLFQSKPGHLDSHTRLLSPNDTIGGHECSTELMMQQFCYVAPGASYTTDPIAITTYEGDWEAGAECYKRWRDTWFKEATPPTWVQDVHSWLQIQIYSAEDRINFRYTDLVDIARDCKQHGIKAIQLTGWAFGGQDRGNPSHATDDALGTREEFKEAIRQCQELGVKVIPFTKWTWVDQSQPNYESELHEHTAKNPWGYPWPAGGYNYFTWTQLYGIGTHPLLTACTASPAWQKLALDEFHKVLDLGADGMLYDEVVHHGWASYCFDKNHDHPQPACLFAYDNDFARLFKDSSEKVDPDFLYAGELWRDEMMAEYHMAYTRFGQNHVGLHRYIAPHYPMMMAVTGFDDRNQINKCLEFRYVISYEPFNFKGRPSDAPDTVKYGGLVDALRRQHRDYIWDGQFKGKTLAAVSVDGKASKDYSTYLHADGTRGAAIICNLDETSSIEVGVAFHEGDGALVVATPESPEPVSVDGPVTIPPRSVAIVMQA